MHALNRSADLVQRLKQGDRSVDLRHADLAGADLSGVDLSELDLSGADLSGALLLRTDLSSTVMHGVNLCDAVLAGANLHTADLTEAQAKRASLSGVDLRDATLFSIDLEGGSLAGADLTNTDVRCAVLIGCNLVGATLNDADLHGANVEDASLCEARLQGSMWSGVSVRGADFRGAKGGHQADWIGVRHVAAADFEGAMLLRRHILDELYLHEFRQRSPLVYWLWWVSSDCGRSLLRWGGLTLVLALIYSVLYAIAGLNASDSTWFTPVYFSIVTLTTLGYGDVLPLGLVGEALALSEALVGYVMLGGLISIMSNKLARRAS